MKNIVRTYLLLILAITIPDVCYGQKAYFADGYHGGVYGHYPAWQTKFMVEKIKEFPQWKLNLELEPETWDVVKERDPESLANLAGLYSTSGTLRRIEFANPAYAQPYCYNVSGESIIRQFIYGMDKIKEHFPDAEFNTYSCEEPCFTSCLPQLLTSFGYKYAVLRNPDTCWGGYTSAYGNDLVQWKSSDGSSILTVPRYACEGLVEGSTWQTESWNNSRSFIESCLESGVKFPVGMCYQDAGWRGGPWLENVIKRYYRPSEYVLWTDYINMISNKVIADDWNFTIEDVKPGLVWGSQILQKLAQEVRITENKLIMAEKIAAFNKVFHSKSYPKKEFDEAWRTLMLSQHHDCWIVPYNGRPGGNWATNVTEWSTKSNQIADGIIERSFSDIPCKASHEGLYITVFNTLGCSRTGLARLVLPDEYDLTEYQIIDIQGKSILSQAISAGGYSNEIVFEAMVPSMGYSTYKLVKSTNKQIDVISVAQLDDSQLRIETKYYQAVINPARGGAITSLIAKKLGNLELVDSSEGLNNMRGYFYDMEKFISTLDTVAKVSVVETGPILAKLKIDGMLADSPYTQLITFYNDAPHIDFDLNIDWQGQPGIGAYSQKRNYKTEEWKKAFYNDKYKLQVRFPVKGIGSRVFKNAPFDVCESELDNTYYDSWDTIKHNVILNWVDVTDAAGKLGVGLFSDHTTSYINSEDVPLGLTVQYIGRALWGRNYSVDGPSKIKYALLPHNNLWDQYGLNSESNSWNEPLLATITNNKPDVNVRSLVEIKTKGVELASVTVDKGAVYLRLFNAEAVSDDIIVNLFCHPEKIQLVQLNNELIKDIIPVKINDNMQQVKLSIPRFGVQTIRLP